MSSSARRTHTPARVTPAGAEAVIPADVAAMRLDAQRVSATEFSRPDQVVAWLGAVQAQDYLGALWAVGLRLKSATEKDVEGALADRTIVRTWPLRGTLHFVAAADARWMIEVLAPRAVASAAGRFRALGLDEATFARARRAIVGCLQGGRALTRHAVYRALERARISVEGQRGIHILWRLAQECLLCFGPRAGKQQTFVLFDEWLPRAKRLPREEALGELACRYFGGHGPATVADFAWWSGQKLSDAHHAIHLVRSRLHEEVLGGRAQWFAARAVPPPAAEPRTRAHLLPAFDEFLVAYADRSAALEGAHAIRVNAGGGILKPTIVVDGRVVGTWQRQLGRRKVQFEPAFFAAISKPKATAVARALRRYAAFLGVSAAD